MQTGQINLIYFSPTKTTERIVKAIAQGISDATAATYDITTPKARQAFDPKIPSGLCIVGCPVYYGRLPQKTAEFLKGMKASGNPVIPVVVYGNRDYEDALLELSDITKACGFLPVAAGAFIGEHSFSAAGTPIAQGRPDESDLDCAIKFGQHIKHLLDTNSPDTLAAALSVPGGSPYCEKPKLPPMAPVTDANLCTVCGTCLEICPQGAFSMQEIPVSSADRCILCNACIRACPTAALSFSQPVMQDVPQRLSSNFKERREPQTFFGT